MKYSQQEGHEGRSHGQDKRLRSTLDKHEHARATFMTLTCCLGRDAGYSFLIKRPSAQVPAHCAAASYQGNAHNKQMMPCQATAAGSCRNLHPYTGHASALTGSKVGPRSRPSAT
eukprot:1158939-Pelagomonas_calceolata.AAC.2